MNNNSNDRATAPERVRPALARMMHTAPVAPEAEGLAWVSVPGRSQPVPVHGAFRRPAATWTLRGSDVTFAELEAERARLTAEGLGAVAGVRWTRSAAGGIAFAWGATAAGAISHLIAGLAAIRPDLDAAAVDPALHGPWAPGEQRTTATGVAIVAPATAGLSADPLLRARRGYLDVYVNAPSTNWIDHLGQVLAADPLPAVVEFQALHAEAGAPEGYVKLMVGDPGSEQLIVAPVDEVARILALVLEASRVRA